MRCYKALAALCFVGTLLPDGPCLGCCHFDGDSIVLPSPHKLIVLLAILSPRLAHLVTAWPSTHAARHGRLARAIPALCSARRASLPAIDKRKSYQRQVNLGWVDVPLKSHRVPIPRVALPADVVVLWLLAQRAPSTRAHAALLARSYTMRRMARFAAMFKKHLGRVRHRPASVLQARSAKRSATASCPMVLQESITRNARAMAGIFSATSKRAAAPCSRMRLSISG